MAWLDAALARAAIDLPTGRAAATWVAVSGAAVVAGMSLWGPVGGALTLVGAVGGPVVALWVGRNRRDRLVDAELPTALETVARSLRSGASLVQAVREARAAATGPLREELALVVDTIDGGASLGEALDGWARRRPGSSLVLAVTALRLGADTGGAQAYAIEGVAATLRDRLNIQREIDALASQARASAVVVASLPVAFLLVAGSAGIDSARFLFETRLGVVCLVSALTLEAVGAVWMQRITRSVT